MEQEFGKGAIRLPEDPRDYKYEVHIGMANEPFDWEKGYDVENELPQKISLKNQGQSFSCGGQAGAYYSEVLHAIHDKEQTEKSAKFIYAPIFVGSGGSWVKDIMERLKTGSADEKVCVSYENGNTPSEAFMQRKQDITEEAIKNSLSDKISVYAFVQNDIDAIARAIRDNHGAILGITGQDNGTWLSLFPKPPTLGGKGYWNHWVYLGKAKLINGKKYVAFKNSWGNIGEQGWQWISAEWLQWLWGITTAVVLPEPTTTFKFTKDLWFGITDSEVKELQKYLNANGFPVAQSGAGSKGQETNFFGTLTKNALVRFQKANRISPAIGYFGRITKLKVNL